MSNSLIIFWTYRNEKQWIIPSLQQLEQLEPREVILCDWCFDPSKPIHSNDWTYEILKERVSTRPRARLIEPVRVPNKYSGFTKLLLSSWIKKPIRLITALQAFIENIYRVNQSLTFNHMRELSKHREVGWWFMNYDADQFYGDQMIDDIKWICSKNSEYGLLTAWEKTFFKDFWKYTIEYEKRIFNNMPHKIYNNTFVKPTRDNHREYLFSRQYYIDDISVKKKHLWFYNHYKFRPNDQNRITEWYALWDRKAPNVDKYPYKKQLEPHPKIIREYFWL
jgi:hypothetical protein